MKRKDLLTALLALLLVIGAGVGTSHAFFTTYVKAEGGYTLHLNDETRFKEEVKSWTKHLTITADKDSEPVFIRARAYGGGGYPISYTDESGKWTDGGDGWYYYADTLEKGQSAEVLLIHIDDVPKKAEEGESFNVVVVYQYTPALYRADGTPYADWDMALDPKGGQE